MPEADTQDIKLTPEQVLPIAEGLHTDLVGIIKDLKAQHPYRNGGNNGYTHFPSQTDPESFVATTRAIDEKEGTDTIAVTIKYPNPSDETSHTAEKLTVTLPKKPTVAHSIWQTHLAGDDSAYHPETAVSNHPSITDKAASFKAKISTFGKTW